MEKHILYTLILLQFDFFLFLYYFCDVFDNHQHESSYI